MGINGGELQELLLPHHQQFWLTKSTRKETGKTQYYILYLQFMLDATNESGKSGVNKKLSQKHL